MNAARPSMQNPIDSTFDVLKKSANINAVETLILALNVYNDTIREAATAALIRRGTTRGQIEVIRRLDSLSAESRQLLESQSGHISTSLRQSLLHGDEQLRRNGLELVRATDNFKQFPALLEMLSDSGNQLHELAAQTVHELVNRLYDYGRIGKETKSSGKHLRNAPKVRMAVLTHLDKACMNFAALKYGEEVVEGILVLGDPENFAVKKLFARASDDCRKLAEKILKTSTHPGVMQLIVDFMSLSFPPPKIFELLQDRSDPEFICHLLRWLPKRVSQMQMKNFRQIESVAWINLYDLTFDFVPPNLQGSLLTFVAATGLPAKHKSAVQEWVLRNGTPEARLKASEAMGTLDSAAITGIVCSNLDSEDPEVQAWATGQLRTQGIPQAITLLLERLDSPLESVRETARQELGSFDFEYMLGLYEHLDQSVCQKAGYLIQKIDADCISKLVAELTSPMRRRRIRAAQCALAMGLHLKVVPALLGMLDDEDMLVRRTGVKVLGDVPASESLTALTRLMDDPSPRVREEVARSLDKLSKTSLPTSKVPETAVDD